MRGMIYLAVKVKRYYLVFCFTTMFKTFILLSESHTVPSMVVRRIRWNMITIFLLNIYSILVTRQLHLINSYQPNLAAVTDHLRFSEENFIASDKKCNLSGPSL